MVFTVLCKNKNVINQLVIKETGKKIEYRVLLGFSIKKYIFASSAERHAVTYFYIFP